MNIYIKPLYLFLSILAFSVSFSCGEDEGTDEELIQGCLDSSSFNYNPNADTEDGSCLEMFGCLGFSGGYSNSGSIGTTLNDAFWDQKMTEEVIIQRNFFSGISANVFILYEPDPTYKNAYANTNGQILFGYHMFYYTIQTYGELPIAGILAHEWGHRTQFSLPWSYRENSHKELEADAFSGYYMALAKQYAWGQIQSYYDNVYATGDYNYNSPTHHGTPDQRLAAAYFGVQTAIEAMNNGQYFSYDELHNRFITEIEQVITAGRSSNEFKEVTYPKNLTEEYIESLFPKM